MRLRNTLTAAFFLVALVPLMLFQAWPHSEVLETETREVQSRNLLLARNIAQSLDRYYLDLRSTFEFMTAQSARDGGLNGAGEMLRSLAFQQFCVADTRTGRVMSGIAINGEDCSEIMTQQRIATLLTIAKEGQTVVSPVLPTSTGENVIHLSYLSGDRLAIGEVATNYIRDLGASISFGIFGHAVIVDQTGQVLSHPDIGRETSRLDMSRVTIINQILAGGSGIQTFYSPTFGGDMIAGYATVPDVGWGVMVRQPLAELQAKADAAYHAALMVMLAGLALALVCAVGFSYIIAGPVEAIASAANGAGHGQFERAKCATPHLLPAELKNLHLSFNTMICRLRVGMRKINTLAYADAVTDLGNRAYFMRRSLEIMADDTKATSSGAMLFIDLDGFKAVNDTFGHEVGDLVLKGVGERLRSLLMMPSMREICEMHLDPMDEIIGPDTIPVLSRLGGDEFAIFLHGAERAAEANDLADVIVEAISLPFEVFGNTAHIGASVGIAHYPAHGDTPEALLKSADIAMYFAKKGGKNRAATYQQTTHGWNSKHGSSEPNLEVPEAELA